MEAGLKDVVDSAEAQAGVQLPSQAVAFAVVAAVGEPLAALVVDLAQALIPLVPHEATAQRRVGIERSPVVVGDENALASELKGRREPLSKLRVFDLPP